MPILSFILLLYSKLAFNSEYSVAFEVDKKLTVWRRRKPERRRQKGVCQICRTWQGMPGPYHKWFDTANEEAEPSPLLYKSCAHRVLLQFFQLLVLGVHILHGKVQLRLHLILTWIKSTAYSELVMRHCDSVRDESNPTYLIIAWPTD